MKATGIICEFNPFHNGHKYLIDSVRRELAPGAVVCVMSGDFVQGGAPSIVDKYVRAKSAVLSGADLVLELPFMYASAPAKEFASGAIKLLQGLGCISDLAFGCESGDSKDFMTAGAFLSNESDSFRQSLQNKLSVGISYASAFAAAASEQLKELPADFFTTPNNILGIEYAKANHIFGVGLQLNPFQRLPESDEKASYKEGILAARSIRRLIAAKGESGNYTDYLPPTSAECLCGARLWDESCQDRLFAMLRILLISKSKEELSEVFEVSEGLESRLKDALLSANSLDELILNTKSKRYTYARLSRILMHILLGLNQKDFIPAKDAKLYARPLAFNETGAAVIKEIKKQGSIPVFTNLNKNVPDDAPEREILKWDIKASDIYNALCKRNIYEGSDYLANPRITIYN